MDLDLYCISSMPCIDLDWKLNPICATMISMQKLKGWTSDV